MNERSDIDRLLRHWIDDGPSTMPDRVIDVVADRISRQPQRRIRRVPWRLHMNANLKVAVGLAAVLVVTVVGWNLLPGRGSSGHIPQATPTPTPAATSSPSPTAAARPDLPDWYPEVCYPNCAGILSAGTHASQYLDPTLTFAVPSGWVNSADWPGFFALFPDNPSNEAEYPRSKDAAQSVVITTDRDGGWADDWGICAGTVDPGEVATADEVVRALAGSPNLMTTEAIPLMIGDLEGYEIDVRLDSNWAGTCAFDPDDPPTKDFTDIRHRLFVLDRPDGSPLVSIQVESLHSSEFDSFAAQARPIVESFQFAGT